MVIVSKEGSILYEGERGLVCSRGISTNKRIEVGESKPGRKLLLSVLDCFAMLKKSVSLLGGARWW
jgi:hypothetical protein